LPVSRCLVSGARHRDPARDAARSAVGAGRVLIDLHCHALAGLDDGPATQPESLHLLRVASEAGTTPLVATPHCSPRYPTSPAAIAEGVAETRAALAPRG